MRFKKNIKEYDQKFADIKRLARGLEKVVNEILASVKMTGDSKSFGGMRIISDDLRVIARHSWGEPFPTMEFELWKDGARLKQDAQLDLHIVRTLHDNLDVLIVLAESTCDGVGQLEGFRTKLARFE